MPSRVSLLLVHAFPASIEFSYFGPGRFAAHQNIITLFFFELTLFFCIPLFLAKDLVP
jgi:hypothetical protein